MMYKHSDNDKGIYESWSRSDIYKFNKDNKDNIYSIDTPPPTVSGSLHMGHIFSYCHADFIARFYRMYGKNVYYPIGFDDNGLPTERLVEKITGVKVGRYFNEKSVKIIKEHTGLDFEDGTKCNISDFIKICQKIVDSAELEFESLFKAIGLSVDWNLKYQTISDDVAKISQMSFIDLYNKGLIYSKFAPTYWDVIDQTALAQADIEEKDIEGVECEIIFDICTIRKDEDGNIISAIKVSDARIMTTRPELLPACYVVLYHPDDERYNGSKLNKKIEQKHNDDVVIYNGIDLSDKMAYVPIANRFVHFVADENVRKDKGTGLVMSCTYGDWQDVEWQKKYGHYAIYQLSSLDSGSDDVKLEYDEDGSIKSISLTTVNIKSINCDDIKIISKTGKVESIYSKTIKDGVENFLNIESSRKKVLEFLLCSSPFQEGKIPKNVSYTIENQVKKPRLQYQNCIKRPVKCGERSGHPIEIIDTEQWYVRILPFKKQLLEASKLLNFHPESMRIKLEQWIDSLNQDWCISRNRFFGIKIPIVKKIINEEMLKGTGISIDQFNELKDYEKLQYYKYELSDISSLPVKENGIYSDLVLDTWFTSSISPQINSKYINDDTGLNRIIDLPMDMRPQAHEIIRTWTFYTLVKAYLHNGISVINHKDNIRDSHCKKVDNVNLNTIDKRMTHDEYLSCVTEGFFTDECNANIEEKIMHHDYDHYYSDTKHIWKNDYVKKTNHITTQGNILIISNTKESKTKNLFVSNPTHDHLPWKNVMLSGWCLASDKSKMSKSKGNVVTPMNLIADKGADSIRLWSASSSLGSDVAYNESLLSNGQRLITKLLNCVNFCSLNFDLCKDKIKTIKKNINSGDIFVESDKLVLSHLYNTVQDAEKMFLANDYFKAKMIIEDFFWKIFCDNYLELIKVRNYGLNANIYKDIRLSQSEKDLIIRRQISSSLTLFHCINTISRLLAPIIPFATEYVYQTHIKDFDLYKQNSIHEIGSWPEICNMIKYDELLTKGDLIFAIIEKARYEKSQAKVSMKAEVQEIIIPSNMIDKFGSIDDMMEDLKHVICMSKNGAISTCEKSDDIMVKLS